MLIADFGPHEMEDLRNEHAHRRLGFADEEMNHMLRAAGLFAAAGDTLTAQNTPLTVAMWQAEKQKEAPDDLNQFEFFPPKSEAAAEKLWQSIGRLAPLRPDFVSVTYGAGGSTRDRTHQCVKRIIDETDLKPAAHLTCVAASKAEVDSVVDDYAAAGVRHVVALRGDMPDMGSFQPHAEGYDGSVALVAALAKRGGFDITVSAYPEKHPESASWDADIDLLKAKIDEAQVVPLHNLCSTQRRICVFATVCRRRVSLFR